VLEGFMIRVKNKLLIQQLVAPMLKGTNNCIKLLVVCRVPELPIVEFLTEKGYRMSLLAENSSNSSVRGTPLTSNTWSKLGRASTGASVKRFLSSLKLLLASSDHLNFSPLMHSVKGVATELKFLMNLV
jgi:hypothetical protein